ncbi:MAG TPA: asparagine synthase (glutamine-hydrolyzing) [Rhodospirillaceae bacterium]|nr:asparagine synthase (glutamine-hydrolyzing) [Magnetovibrio sp.]HBT43584.1 asparagine synthase (glutamine-hydrolyzing) [Rhodospirillaceae bacterium]HCS70957.1 asparagine synthase (glutamine-hydrolyzing) [Rhodospirillaceae bacterium]|tara:strand:+ start:33672 stop:35603 length:1932 start_codon:yes stop_codon:yes gene_type:complete
MCGIAGILAARDGSVAPQLLQGLSEAIRHRGPDDHGYFAWTPGGTGAFGRSPDISNGHQLALAHRRLSIIDLSEDGRQPMSTEDGRFTVIFNGEIYNYLEIRKELEGLGRRFRTSSDTEVLLQTYAHWGADCLARLVGMWAVAIFDNTSGELFLARDPFGIKPLYYMIVDGAFVFASEVRALLTYPGAPRTANPAALHDYLRFGFTDRGAETMIAGITALAPAHFVRISADKPTQVRPQRYWRIDPGAAPRRVSRDDAAAELQDIMRRNVELHLRSDVPVAIALSGGLDSASIVMMEKDLRRQKETRTFSFIADSPEINEEAWIDLLIDRSGVKGHKVRVDPQSLSDDLDNMVRAADEPFSTTSIFAQTKVFEAVSAAGFKVILSGQGADETFAGYLPYLSSRLRGLLGKGQLARAARFIRASSRENQISPAYIITRLLGQISTGAVEQVLRRVAGEPVTPAWLNKAWFERHGVTPRGVARNRRDAPLKDHLASTLFDYTLPAILRHSDRTSMAQSIECRVPFLTTELVEFAYALPDDYLIDDTGRTKSILRQAMRGIVPSEILDRRDKIGFDTPQQEWLAANMGTWDAALESDAFRAIPAFDHQQVDAARKAMHRDPRAIGFSLWRWVNLARWADLNGIRFS